MEAVVQLEFEIANYDIIVQDVSHYVTGTPFKVILVWHNVTLLKNLERTELKKDGHRNK